MCRCDFLCSKAVVQFVCWDVCVVVVFFFLFFFVFVFVFGIGGVRVL